MSQQQQQQQEDALSSEPYRAMSFDSDVADFQNWDAARLGLYFRKRGLGDYCEVLQKHKITGRLAPLLGDSDLKEMGIHVVGDRLMFKHFLKELSRRERFNHRIQSLWVGEERIFFSEAEQSVMTCGGFCPVDPSVYTLTTNHLRVKRVVPVRCGPVRLCCFGANYRSNNIDLSKVDDVDVIGIPAPCIQRIFCCARGKDLLEVESRFEKGGKIFLTLEEGHGDAVATMISNQVEESQKMERN